METVERRLGVKHPNPKHSDWEMSVYCATSSVYIHYCFDYDKHIHLCVLCMISKQIQIHSSCSGVLIKHGYKMKNITMISFGKVALKM